MSKGMVVAVTGATGFVGRNIVAELLAAGHTVRALARDVRKAAQVLPRDAGERLQVVAGELAEAEAMGKLLAGAGACVHLVGIIREKGAQTFQRVHVEGTRAALDAASAAGVKRFVHMSALGVGAEGRCAYQRTKFEAEGLVRRSGLDWTIFRCGFIHGVDSEAINMFAELCSGDVPPYLFIPYFTRFRIDDSVPLGPAHPVDPVIQPVAVPDVARAFRLALERPGTIGEVYNLAGGERLTYAEFLSYIRDHTPGANERLAPYPLPSEAGVIIAKAAKAVGIGGLLPFDAGMAYMGGQDNVAELEKVKADFGFAPRPFRESFLEYAKEL